MKKMIWDAIKGEWALFLEDMPYRVGATWHEPVFWGPIVTEWDMTRFYAFSFGKLTVCFYIVP
jgi:hypothetical protein